MLAVDFNIGGTATNTFDYARLYNSAVFLPGQLTTTVTVTPVDDTLVEGDETVILTLATGHGLHGRLAFNAPR